MWRFHISILSFIYELKDMLCIFIKSQFKLESILEYEHLYEY